MTHFNNDPLNDPTNEYSKLKQTFISDYQSRTAHIQTDEDELEYQNDFGNEFWVNEQKKNINRAFLKIKTELDKKKAFYFGCPLTNYEATYQKRLTEFTSRLNDTTETDFVNAELEYLQNTLTDIEQAESSEDGYSLTGIQNFRFALSIIEQLSFEQFVFSTNKKIEFLNERLEALKPKPKEKLFTPLFKPSTKKGAKTDLIRVLNALYELKLIDKTDGQTPTKQEFMQAMGEYLGMNLSKYASNLSQSQNEQTLEVNLKVFDDMKEATQKAHYLTKNK